MRPELDDIFGTILALLNDNLLQKASTDESEVFYHNMKADYYRYIAEFKIDTSVETRKCARVSVCVCLQQKNIACSLKFLCCVGTRPHFGICDMAVQSHVFPERMCNQALVTLQTFR